MTRSIALTHGGTMVNSMDEEWSWYLSGAIDSVASITVKVGKDSRLSIGYYMKPVDQVLGMVDEYAEEVNNSIRINITKVEDIRNSLEPLLDGMVLKGA